MCRGWTDLEELEDVVPDVEVGEARVQLLEVGVVHVLKHDRRRFRLSGRPGMDRARQGTAGIGREEEEEEDVVSSSSCVRLVGWARPRHACGLTAGSLTTSRRAMMFGPPARSMRILISLLIFFFLTGLSTLTTHFWLFGSAIPSNTCTQTNREHARRSREERESAWRLSTAQGLAMAASRTEDRSRARLGRVTSSAGLSTGSSTDLRVLSPPDLADDFKVVLVAPLHLQVVCARTQSRRRADQRPDATEGREGGRT